MILLFVVKENFRDILYTYNNIFKKNTLMFDFKAYVSITFYISSLFESSTSIPSLFAFILHYLHISIP